MGSALAERWQRGCSYHLPDGPSTTTCTAPTNGPGLRRYRRQHIVQGHLAAVAAISISALLVGAMVLFSSCGATTSGVSQPAADVSGTWAGSSSAGCFLTGHRCNAYRLITLSLVQSGSSLSGSYTCAYGTMNCLGLNNTGTIAYGRIDGSYMPDLRIEFPDATNCLYQGHFIGSESEGGYMCFCRRWQND